MQMMKRYDCLVPGCKWHAEGADSADIVGRAVDHMRRRLFDHRTETGQLERLDDLLQRLAESDRGVVGRGDGRHALDVPERSLAMGLGHGSRR